MTQNATKRRTQGAVMGWAVVMAGATGVAGAVDQPCIDYYAIGESHCAPKNAATPASSVSKPQGTPVLLSPAATPAQDRQVDDFLDNYGKPPREFVEFYLNPTPENAQKWVKAYQSILQKSQNMSQMWSQAEQSLVSPTVAAPVAVPVPVVKEATPAGIPSNRAPSVNVSSAGSLGAFAGTSAGAGAGAYAPVSNALSLTYYFSQTCPYCARLTPELSAIANAYGGKLKLTCVDVTPYSETTSPSPAYLRGKLTCDWRLPEEGELEANGVRMTPTLLVSRPGGVPVRLSGYMSQAQLLPYLK